MDRLIAALERRLGRYAPAHIIWWLVGLSGVLYFALQARPELGPLLELDPDAILHGELWRVVTFLFMPWSSGSGTFGIFFTMMALFFLYTIGTSLEAQWGSFRFDAFYLLAALGTIATSFLFGPVTNFFINQALLLAFAIEFPDYQILFAFILPIRMQWLGWLTAAALAWQFVTEGWPERSAIAVAVGAMMIFCGSTLTGRLAGRSRVSSRKSELGRFRAAAAQPVRVRVCALCGKSEKDDPKLEFRVCNCAEKCGGKMTEYCLVHARAH